MDTQGSHLATLTDGTVAFYTPTTTLAGGVASPNGSAVVVMIDGPRKAGRVTGYEFHLARIVAGGAALDRCGRLVDRDDMLVIGRAHSVIVDVKKGAAFAS